MTTRAGAECRAADSVPGAVVFDAVGTVSFGGDGDASALDPPPGHAKLVAASSKHGSMDQVILAGGCAHIPGVDALVQERLGIPTVVARPFSAMTVAAKARPSVLAKDERAGTGLGL